jgi:hypothetical protein
LKVFPINQRSSLQEYKKILNSIKIFLILWTKSVQLLINPKQTSLSPTKLNKPSNKAARKEKLEWPVLNTLSFHIDSDHLTNGNRNAKKTSVYSLLPVLLISLFLGFIEYKRMITKNNEGLNNGNWKSELTKKYLSLASHYFNWNFVSQ